MLVTISNRYCKKVIEIIFKRCLKKVCLKLRLKQFEWVSDTDIYWQIVPKAVTEKLRRPNRYKGAVPSRRNHVGQIVPKARCRHGETPSTRSFQRRGAVTEKPRRPYRSISWRGTVSRLLSAERSRRPGMYGEIMSTMYAGAKSRNAR